MSYQVIARKYRPQSFDEVTGQSLITDTLKNAIVHERVAHGYIFSGARGVGKTTTARILAKSLNCAQGMSVSPCGDCPSCTEIASGNSVDVFEVDAASNRGIDEIRELRDSVRYLPARDLYKVFIIDEAHMLTTEAFNALLKTLEEPPPRSLFVLCTTEAHKLPATIHSRCQHFSFRLLDYPEIMARLKWVVEQEQIEADEGALSAIAEAAEGSVRDALSLLDQAISSGETRLEEARVRRLMGVVPIQLLREITEAIEAGDSGQIFEAIARLTAEGYELNHFCGEFTRFVRNLAIAKSCGGESHLLQVPPHERDAIAKLADRFSEEDLTRFFHILVRTEAEMRHALNPRFQMELGLLKMAQAGKLASLETLIREARSRKSSGTPEGGSKPGGGMPSPGSGAGGDRKIPAPVRRFSASSTATPEPLNPAPPVVPAVKTPPTSAVAPVPSPAISTPPAMRTSPLQPPSNGEADEDPRLGRIKNLAFGQFKLLSSCLDTVSGWRFENGEVRFLVPQDHSWAMDLLGAREQQEKLRQICEEALGEPVRICVKLDDRENPDAAIRLSARERAEKDEAVEAFRKAFECTLVDVIDLSGK